MGKSKKYTFSGAQNYKKMSVGFQSANMMQDSVITYFFLSLFTLSLSVVSHLPHVSVRLGSSHMGSDQVIHDQTDPHHPQTDVHKGLQGI